MSYELRSHTADIGVEAWGETLGAVFGAVADGMTAAMCESLPETGERAAITVTAESLEALLFDYLDELIYERDVRGVLPTENTGEVRAVESENEDAWQIEATYRGVPLAGLGAREVKAVTYSEMVLEETDDGWHAYVVLDM